MVLPAAAACLLSALSAVAQTPVFLEPLKPVDTRGPEAGKANRIFKRVDGAKYLPWLQQSDAARRAVKLYAQAFAIVEAKGNPRKQPREYPIALVPGGNHAAVGFQVQGSDGKLEDYPNVAFMLIAPDERSFQSTLLHETGHVAMSMLAGGRELPRADVCAIPHTTAALTDRATAFSEGYAIHFEALTAHVAMEPGVRGRFHRESVMFGNGRFQDVEFFRQSSDLASYSQSVARYLEVRENNYAFEPAYSGPDYLRIQMEKARDFARLRDANQLLQSEGFHASFFYLWLIRGEGKPAESVIVARQERILRALSAMFDGIAKFEEDTPWLLHFVKQYLSMYPDEKPAMIDAFLDLTHGVFLDAGARELWRGHYLGALQLDRQRMNLDGITTARKQWSAKLNASPDALFERVAPQVGCALKGADVKIAAFGEASPLIFDVNTAPEAILRLAPGISDAQVRAWLEKRPFTTLAKVAESTGFNGCQKP
jgi:hypothetical protein